MSVRAKALRPSGLLYSFQEGRRQNACPEMGWEAAVKGAYLLYPPVGGKGRVMVSDEYFVYLARLLAAGDSEELLKAAEEINRLFEEAESGRLEKREEFPSLLRWSWKPQAFGENSFTLHLLKENGRRGVSVFLRLERNGERKLFFRALEFLKPLVGEELYKKLKRLEKFYDHGNVGWAARYLLLHLRPFTLSYFARLPDGSSLYGVYPANFKKRMSLDEILKEAEKRVAVPKNAPPDYKKGVEELWKRLAETARETAALLSDFHSSFKERVLSLAEEEQLPENLTVITYRWDFRDREKFFSEWKKPAYGKVLILTPELTKTDRALAEKLKKTKKYPPVGEVKTFNLSWLKELMGSEELVKDGNYRPAFYHLAVALALRIAMGKKSGEDSLVLFKFYGVEKEEAEEAGKENPSYRREILKRRAYDDFIAFARLVFGLGAMLPFQGFSEGLLKELEGKYSDAVASNLLHSGAKDCKEVEVRVGRKIGASFKGHLVREIPASPLVYSCRLEVEPELSPLSLRHRLFEFYDYEIRGNGEETAVKLRLRGRLLRMAGGEEVAVGNLPAKLENPVFLISDPLIEEFLEPVLKRFSEIKGEGVRVRVLSDYPITHLHLKELSRKAFLLFKEESPTYAGVMKEVLGKESGDRHFYTVFPPLPPTVKRFGNGFTTSHGETFLLFPDTRFWLVNASVLELLFLALGVYRNDLSNAFAREKRYLTDNRAVKIKRLGREFSFPFNSLLMEGIARFAAVLKSRGEGFGGS